MNEFNINLVGKEQNIIKEEILNNFDFNYIPMNNLPVSYFPLNNQLLSDELKIKDIQGNLSIDLSKDDGLDIVKKILKIIDNINLQITNDIYVDLLLVGAGGGANADSGGGGGEVIFFKDYKLKKGSYNIIVGSGVDTNIDGNPTYILKNNNNLMKAKGGNKANEDYGGISLNGNHGKGSDKNPSSENSTRGIENDIEGSLKYYGDGGLNKSSNDRDGDRYGEGARTDSFSKKGIFILKYKDEDINNIKKINNIYRFDISNKPEVQRGVEPDSVKNLVEDNYYLFKYKNTDSENRLVVNKNITCDILLVGGGGGGGWFGGGGGGGDVIEKKDYILNSGTYIINIGKGGLGGTKDEKYGKNGNNTSISLINSPDVFILAAGGGGGGSGAINAPNPIVEKIRNDVEDENKIYVGKIPSSTFKPELLHVSYESGEKSKGGYGGETINTMLSYKIYRAYLKIITENSEGGNAILRTYLTNPVQGTIAYHKHLISGGGGNSKNKGSDGNIILSRRNGDIQTLTAGNGAEAIISSIDNKLYGSGGNGGYGVNVFIDDTLLNNNEDKGSEIGTGIKGGNMDGVVNTGGGGAGSISIGLKEIENGKNGGSGIIIIKIKKEYTEITIPDEVKLIEKDMMIINDVKEELKKKIKFIEDKDIPYNNFLIIPLVLLNLLIWIFIFLFLLKLVHHYFANIYLYILIFIIILLLIIGSLWFLYSNNDL